MLCQLQSYYHNRYDGNQPIAPGVCFPGAWDYAKDDPDGLLGGDAWDGLGDDIRCQFMAGVSYKGCHHITGV